MPQALHRVIPQARPQAFAQLLPGQVLLRALVEQLAVPGHEQRQVLGHQPQVAHRRRHLDLFQAPTGQFEQHRRVALGAEQPHRNQGVGAFDVLQVQGKALHATVATTEKGRQVGGEPAQGKQQRLMGLHIEIQLDAQVEAVRRLIEGQPQRALAEQGIQVLEQAAVKTPGQAGPGQLPQLLEAAHPHARQAVACSGASPRRSMGMAPRAWARASQSATAKRHRHWPGLGPPPDWARRRSGGESPGPAIHGAGALPTAARGRTGPGWIRSPAPGCAGRRR